MHKRILNSIVVFRISQTAFINLVIVITGSVTGSLILDLDPTEKGPSDARPGIYTGSFGITFNQE